MKKKNRFAWWLLENNQAVATSIGLSLIALSILGGVFSTSPDFVDEALKHTSVMITNMTGSSGGSGVVYSSGGAGSVILTNAHVCGLLYNGGIVHHDGRRHLVSRYVPSARHDLCAVYVRKNLYIDTPLAYSEPNMYENAAISGHPALLPNVITKGHFSDQQIIKVLVGFRPCSDSERETDLMCSIFGVFPIVESYEAILVTATILPGSSGSAVFNKNGQISALVFAGNRGIGYAYAVPYVYVKDFLKGGDDVGVIPNYRAGATQDEASKNWKKVRTACGTGPLPENAVEVCQAAERNSLWISER